MLRGVYLQPMYDGAAMLVNHEAIPDRMPAMQMPMRVKVPGLLDGLAEGAARAGAKLGAGDVSRAKPATSAPVEDWDRAIAGLLDPLLEADLRWRLRGALRRMIGG